MIRTQRASDSQGSTIIKLGKYEFKPDKYELLSGDITLKLSSRESEVLGLLVEYRNRIISRKKLLIDIWGDDSYYNSRTLDVYVRKMRKYLSEDPNIEIITLKGKGYHLITP